MSGFGPSLIPELDYVVNVGRGIASNVIGQYYDVYRIGPSIGTSGVIGPTTLIASKVNAYFERLTARDNIEIESSVRFLAYKATVDLNSFLPGDVFVQRTDSYRYERGLYTLASIRPMPRIGVAIATPVYATLTRPESNPLHIDSGIGPQSVPVAANEWPLTCTPGSAFPFAFLRTGAPATIPIGMILGRLRDMPKADTAEGELYDDTRRQNWDVFMPILPGQSIIPRDIITGSNGDRYEITGVQLSTSSFFGQLVTCQRIRS